MASVRAQWVRWYAVNEMGGVWGARTVSERDMDQYFTMCGGGYQGHDHKTSWCGIFAAYVMRLAGARVSWRVGKGFEIGDNVQLISGNKGLDEGDVAWARPNHYFIIVQPPGNSGVPLAVHGNYGGAGSNHVLFYGYHTKYPVSSIALYYRVF